MNNLKYKILWLDDYFKPINEDNDPDVNHDRWIFQTTDVKIASNFGLEIVGVSNFEEFCTEMNNISSYQAIIFDLRGMEKNSEITDRVMYDALELVKNRKDIPKFVYSANINYDKFELPIATMREAGRCFDKGLGATPLYKKILEVLNSNLHFYEGHEECLMVFTKGYLDATSNKAKMDELLKKYDEMDRSYAPYNNMRNILENVLQTLTSVGLIKEPSDKFNKRIAYLAEKVNFLKDKDGNIVNGENNKPILNYEDPVVSFSDCRREIKYIFKYLDDITNRYSHFLESSPNYLRQGETVLDYNALVQQSVYPAFFVAIKWFFGYMEKNYSHS